VVKKEELVKPSLDLIGKFINVRITMPIGSVFAGTGMVCDANYGEPISVPEDLEPPVGVFVIGIDHPVRCFDGRVVALVHLHDGRMYAVACPRRLRLIEAQIRPAIAFFFGRKPYRLTCLFEKSCGAVIYYKAGGKIEYLLIKNRRSAHWGFPKGHIEDGETPEETARREIKEETGLDIDFVGDFVCQSEYTIQGKVEKSVTIFLARASRRHVILQEEEIEFSNWLPFEKAVRSLRFENDREILRKAAAALASLEA
jgi:8-oxo-dGTP pyrophosphatase MutT (NUDIX family)